MNPPKSPFFFSVCVVNQVMVVTPTRELAVQVGRMANELLGNDQSGGGGKVALLIEESGVSLGAMEAPVLVGTAKVLWAEMQKCNGTAAASSASASSRGERRARQERGEGNDKGSQALEAALKNLKALVIDEVRTC